MSETRRILTPYVSRHWPALAGVCGSTAVLAAAELAGPWPLKLVIDRIAGREAPFELGGADIRFLALVAGLVLAIALVGALAAYTAELWLNRAAERIVHDLRVAVYAHLQRLSLAFHHRRPTGDLVSNVTGDVAAVRTLFADSAGEIASSVLLLAGMLTVTLLLDPALALATFAVTPALALVTWRYTRRTRVLARKQRAQEGEIASLATEALSAMQVVKAFGSEAWEQDRVRARSERRRTIGVEAVRTEARFAGLVDVIGAGAVTVAMVVGVFRVSAGALSPGDLIVFVSYAGKTYKPLRAIAKQLPKAQRGLARAERIAEVLASAAILVERPGAYRGGRAAGEVALRNVSFAYEPSRSALHDVSVRIAPGERVVVVGRSGAGKSTLGALVARLYDPDEGVVTIDGRDARDCSLEWLREQVGVLLQETVLFSGTVADNIAYATDATHDEIVAAARAADAHGFVSKLPGGYDTMLGPRGAGLSGGQRQRIGIARVLLRDPAVLVLDEPTTGLDAASEAEVMEGLDRLMADRTTIIVTHSRDLASRAARTLVVEDGRLVADRTSAGSTTHGARGRVSVDPTLPAFSHLLDAEVMTSAFERSLGRDVERVAIVDARLKPGRELVVRYDVEAGGRHTAVALIQSRPARLARTVARRAPATEALSFDEELGALIQWLPLDIALPALALPREDLLRRVEAAGVAVDGDAIGPELLSYKPLARAVMRLDGHVLKVYDDERRVARAARGLAAAAALDLRTPQLEAASPELCAVVQSRLEGRAPDDPRSAATEAGDVLRLVHALPATAPRLTARDQLDRAAKHAAVVTTLLPALAPRLERLLARLADAAPGGEAVLSHGDFESGQLLRTAHGPGLLDLDDVCVAAPALDFANYASHVVHGTQSLDDAYGVLAELADGYGGTPAELEWHLAAALVCRSPTPFRRFQDDWPARVESLVEAAEAAVRR